MKNKVYILCAAIHYDDGQNHPNQPVETGIVYCGHRHGNIFTQLEDWTKHRGTQGFLTSTGEFVDRKEGLTIALEADQVIENNLGAPHIGLFSEDLY